MVEVKESLEIDVPVDAAYDQWSRFESFPIFMDNVTTVEQRSPDRLLFRAEVQGVDRSWMARIVKRDPNREIRWESESGTRNTGRVLFESLGENRTRLTLLLEYEPEDWRERIWGASGLVDRQVKMDMERFKRFIERKQQKTAEDG